MDSGGTQLSVVGTGLLHVAASLMCNLANSAGMLATQSL